MRAVKWGSWLVVGGFESVTPRPYSFGRRRPTTNPTTTKNVRFPYAIQFFWMNRAICLKQPRLLADTGFVVHRLDGWPRTNRPHFMPLFSSSNLDHPERCRGTTIPGDFMSICDICLSTLNLSIKIRKVYKILQTDSCTTGPSMDATIKNARFFNK